MIFNTEAHAFPRFDLGKLFKTGWERKPRDAEGKVVAGRTSVEGEMKQEIEGGEVEVKTVQVTRTKQVERETVVVENGGAGGAAAEAEKTPEPRIVGAPEVLG